MRGHYSQGICFREHSINPLLSPFARKRRGPIQYIPCIPQPPLRYIHAGESIQNRRVEDMRVHALRLENAQALGVVGACGGEIVRAAEEVAEGGVDAAVLPLARLFPGYGYEGRAYGNQ